MRQFHTKRLTTQDMSKVSYMSKAAYHEPVDLRFSCKSLQDPDFVEIYYKKWKMPRHLISPIFKDKSDQFSNPDAMENLNSLSTLNTKEKDRVTKIVNKNIPSLALWASKELASKQAILKEAYQRKQ